MSEQRIKELDAEIMLKSKQIVALAADMLYADGGAYWQMARQLQALVEMQNNFLIERVKLTEHTVEIPEWVRNQRYREQAAKKSAERIKNLLDSREQKQQNS